MGMLSDFISTLLQLVTLLPAAAIGIVLHVITFLLDCASPCTGRGAYVCAVL